MRQVIILSLVCVNALCLPLKLEAKEVSQGNGLRGKHKWLQNNIKQKVVVIHEKIF